MNRLPFWKASSTFGKRVAPLLDTEFFLLGRDIEHPAGNRLAAAGFVRRRSSEERDHCSAYQRDGITLWGFGLHWRGADASLYLPRKPWAPKLLPQDVPLADVWSKREMPPGHMPITPDEEALLRFLLCEALSWLARYEAQVWETDLAWRKKCLAASPHAYKTATPLAMEWQDAVNSLSL
jgi:hypothetical protein